MRTLLVIHLSRGIFTPDNTSTWYQVSMFALSFSGYLRDVSGDYFLTYHFVGTLTMCASLVLFVSHYKVKDVSEAVIEIDVEEEKERS